MPSYPAREISTPDEQLNVLQITDLHLSMPNTPIEDSASIAVSNCQHSFAAILKQALSEDIRCDLIIVTGDLVNEVQPILYDHIFAVLKATNIPFACIAGNHDVTDELNRDLPFPERYLVARVADPRLLSRHVIESDHWQILLLNSSVPGKTFGNITNADIDWLCAQLTKCQKPALLALHHHLLPMHSKWIDQHIAKNTDTFWQRIRPFIHLRSVINGHTHQEQLAHYQGVTVYTTPSTCYQYKPYEDDFAYDESALPGYRWLQLANNGRVASWVKRLDT